MSTAPTVHPEEAAAAPGSGDVSMAGGNGPPPPARVTLCDVVALVAMNGLARDVVRCVNVCTSMRTNAELWERVVDLPHVKVGAEPALPKTRLIQWVKAGDLARVLETLDRGARVGTRDARGQTALFWASFGGHTAIVRELLRRGAAADVVDTSRAVLAASHGGHTAVVLELAAHGAVVDTRGAVEGETALMWACSCGHAATAAELLRLGADVNAQSLDGMSALMYAAYNGSVDAARVLLAAPGVDAGRADVGGGTALTWARARGRADVAALLEAAGAK